MIREILGRIACRVGRHDWTLVASLSGRRAAFARCRCCGKVQWLAYEGPRTFRIEW